MLKINLGKLIILFGLSLLRFASSEICNQHYKRNSDTFCRIQNVTANKNDCERTKQQCEYWCKEQNITWSIIDSNVGHVKFSLDLLPPTCCRNNFKISDVLLELFVLDDTHCNYKQISTCRHSVKGIRVQNCSKESDKMEFDVKFVFTSRYYFQIKSFSGRRPKLACRSNVMNIKTNYVKRLISNTPNFTSIYEPLSQSLLFSLSGEGGDIGLPLAERVDIILRPGCDQDVVQFILNNNEEECCNKEIIKVKNCNCFWKSESLVCKFSEIAPGNYCLHVDAYGPRCSRQTLWIENGNSCTWKFQETVVQRNTTYTAPSAPVISQTKMILLISFGLVMTFSLGIFLWLNFKTYPKKMYRYYVKYKPFHFQVQQISSLLNKPKILLLYSRDCANFMTVMDKFRSLLQESLHAQVYDMWNDENEDDVMEVGHQWALKYISNPNVKVIVIVSPCSKIFEDALIDNKTIEYKINQSCFDNFFLYSFKEVVTVANCSLDNYKRFFVVRLDEPGCEENKFSTFSPCTVYTIPQHFKDLSLQLFDLNPGEVLLNCEEALNMDQLMSSLEELKRFKVINPNYLDELLSVVDSH